MKIKEGKNQKTLLLPEEELRIIETYNARESCDGFSVVTSYDAIKDRNYSFSPGQYFEVKVNHENISHAEFTSTLSGFQRRLEDLFSRSNSLARELKKEMGRLEV
jgi:type I restriction enzyme M protein